MTSVDSSFAGSMNEHVLTMIASASPASDVTAQPSCASLPSMTSLSTRFLAQPRLARNTRRGALAMVISAVIHELDGIFQVHPFDERDDLLQVVFRLARDPQLVVLDLRSHLELLGLDGFDELLGAVFRDALLARHDLTDRALRSGLGFAVVQ